MDLHEDAINKIMGDMDDLESKKMTPGGATITITVSPNGGEGEDEGLGDLPADHDISMCGGGCAMHKGGEAATTAEEMPGIPKLASGGPVPATPVPAEVDDMRVPPFLRKKKAV